jgi:hypothetical protein
MILPMLLLAAHWVAWSPEVVQMGVSIGTKQEEHLILMVPREGCSAGMKIHDGQYGDFEKAVKLIEHSKVCSEVEQRAKDYNAKHLP